ncbi:GNAT family N-acetyltransferase [Sphingomonas sp.]|jgi:CelD/BcsL family acetyltransferase involved in cellulose biosynthesis|uniref:GNAT family N-acetyltransferase n=1 Tax=Sphingomonas sp. TaxID=28214 RepID=UPI002D7FAF47|nr:GNAT family N-acetyltransferase [Sphingomonas sp.]HEU0044099.1 GNAT family N-acetyltransferase [Sphingomonas sp.]
MTAAALKFQVGARTLLSIPRRLRRVSLSLDAVLAGRAPALAPLAPGEDGYSVTSLPEVALPALTTSGSLAYVRQHYRRYWVDLAAGEAAWRAGLSSNARAQIKRKAKKLGDYRVERFRTPDEIAAFHHTARAVSLKTYQEKLLGSGLPADPSALLRLAAADEVRAWLLSRDDAPIAYLCCVADGETLRYDYVGHDPAHGDLSPGAVLQADALVDLFADRFARFDFTEGEGQHKRQFATGGEACADVLLLRPTLGNRASLAALKGWDVAVAGVKRVDWLKRAGERLRR